jgi:hypothetical protein
MKRRTSKKSSLTAKAEAAFAQESRKVVQRAKQTGTPVIVWKDGRIQAIPGEQVELPAAPTNSRTAQPNSFER